MFGNKVKISTFTTLIQYSHGGPSQSNQENKRKGMHIMYTERQIESTKKTTRTNMSLALQNTRTEHLKEDYLDILETNTEISKIPFQGHEIPMDKFNKIYKTCTIKTTKNC